MTAEAPPSATTAEGLDPHGEATVVRPALPGYLTLREIATLAGVAVVTVRSYQRDSAAGFPPSAWRAGSTPLWHVHDVLEWLAQRPYSRTVARQRDDGAIEVLSASDYTERKAAGRVGSARLSRSAAARRAGRTALR